MILNGRNRHAACLNIGFEPMPQIWDGKGDPLDYVVSKILNRRHLCDSQRAVVGAKVADMNRGGDRRSENFKAPIGGLKKEAAAKLLNVSGRSVTRAKAVLERGVPELQAGYRATTSGYGSCGKVCMVCTGALRLGHYVSHAGIIDTSIDSRPKP